jgi:hypothetical protein
MRINSAVKQECEESMKWKAREIRASCNNSSMLIVEADTVVISPPALIVQPRPPKRNEFFEETISCAPIHFGVEVGGKPVGGTKCGNEMRKGI